MSADVKLGIYGIFSPLDAIYETALWADRQGLDSYWLGDRAIAFPEPDVIEVWSALAAVATKTTRITLGVSVTDPFRRTPSILAQTIAALDHISGGRVIPGIGIGEKVNLAPFGIHMTRARERLEEFTVLLKKYWSGEPIVFQGSFFQVEGGIVRPRPVQAPHPPVWIAANTRKSLEVVARVGDGWLTAAKSPEMYAMDLAFIRTEAERLGRDPTDITPGLFMYTVLSESREHAQRVADEVGRAILVWWRGSLDRLGVEAGSPDLTVSSFDASPDATARWLEAARAVPDEALEQLITFGTPEEVSGRVREFVEAGVRHFVVVSLDGFGDLDRWKETASLLRTRVMPAVGIHAEA